MAGADRLRSSLAALIGTGAAENNRLGIAVSGGPDSMALLLIAHAACPGRIAAASVDHRLRPAAAEECRYVADICAERGIPHAILTAEAPPDPPTQAGARTLRYTLLEEWRAAQDLHWLLTAHHADDQLETLIMRLNRSSGLHGLAGVRARQGSILRPLLDWRREDLMAILDATGVAAITDPSNIDPRYDRARLRSAMAGQQFIDAAAASASAVHLASAAEAFDWMVAKLAGERLSEGGADGSADGGKPLILDTRDLPDALLHQLTTLILRRLGGAPRGEDITRLITTLRRGAQATLAGWMIAPNAPQPGHWRFTAAPPRRHG